MIESLRPPLSKITSELLMETGFHLPGRSEHIPLVIEPITIRQEQKKFLEEGLPILSDLIMKARAFNPEERVINEELLEKIRTMPAIWRFDFLISPNENLKMLELNGTRPGGIWLLLKAKEALAKVGLDTNNVWMPELDVLGNFFQTLAAQSNNPLIVLAYTAGYVGEIEMPPLAKMLNQWSKDVGLSLEFISAERSNFSEEKGKIISRDGRTVGVFYENAGPENRDGRNITWLFGDQYQETIVINGPQVGSCDDKTLMATLYDERFRELLSPEQTAVIEEIVPPTYLLQSPGDLKTFLPEKDRFFFKIGYGFRASSGKGVYDGSRLDKSQIEEIQSSLTSGVRFIAQQRISSEQPEIIVSKLKPNNEIVAEPCFVDLDPYVLSDGENFYLIGFLARAKPTHPINLTQGGALSVVKVK